MYSPMPNGGQNLEGLGSEEDSDITSDDEDSDSGSDDSGSDEVEVVSPPRTEGRFKKSHDPALDRGRAGGSTTRSSKRSRTVTPEPTEKIAKQPKVTTTKPRKALPRLIVDVPIVST